MIFRNPILDGTEINHTLWALFNGYRICYSQSTLKPLMFHASLRQSTTLSRGIWCWDSAVGIATGYGMNDRWGRSSSPGRVKNFLFSTSSRPALGSTQPPVQWVPEALSSAVKRPGREADHSPPASSEVKKIWIYISTPPYDLMA
jgi:hypothetical protein